MKKRISLGSLSMESFDQAPTGNVLPDGQPVNPEQPLITAGYTETIPGGNTGNYAAEVKTIDPKRILNTAAIESQVEHDAKQLWGQLYKAFDVENEHEQRDILGLHPGATDTQINMVAAYFHAKLPELLVAIWKIHNGQASWWSHGNEVEHEALFPHVTTFFGTDDSIHDGEGQMEIKDQIVGWFGPIDTDPRIKAVAWSKHWLPLASNEDTKDNTIYCLDFDPAPGGKVGQVFKFESRGNRRIHLGDSFDTWFPGMVKRIVGHASMESLSQPRYPLTKALEEAVVIDDDELDALVSQANNLTKTCDNTAEISLEAASDLAKSKMHLRFKRLKDSFADSFKSVDAMIRKYRDRLDELKQELSGTTVHGQLDVNMSGLWQHFSTEAGPVTNNLVGKVKEDLAFSQYILTDFSKKAFEELKGLEHALHTGQGNSDDEAKRTALDVEKLSGPAEYMNQKWLCTAGEQPYLSVTGIYGRQGTHPRPVAINGVSLDRLAQLACQYTVREYGSFLHGMKKLFTHDSKKNVRLSETDLEQLIKLGEEYLNAAQVYLQIYNSVWNIFHHIDASLDQIWDDFDLTDYEIELGDEESSTTVSWQTSGTGDIRRRAKVFDQLMAVVRNFADATILPGFHEMTRALRAAKYHTYIVAAGLKAAKSTAMESEGLALEFFGKKKSSISIRDAMTKLVDFCQKAKMEEPFRLEEPQTKLLETLQQHVGMSLPKQFLELYQDCGDPADVPPFLPSRTFLRSMKRIMMLHEKWVGRQGYQQHWIPLSDTKRSNVETAYVLDAKTGKVLYLNFITNKQREEAKDFREFIATSVEEYIDNYKPKYPGSW